MKQIINTTDGKYLGLHFNYENNSITLASDVNIQIEKILKIDDEITRYTNTNYVIDAIEIKEN